MKFGPVQRAIFGASQGSYSVVTARENFDSQITLTDYETAVALGHFGPANLHVGNVGSDPRAASKQFRLYPSGEPVSLNLVFPKPEKTELRLYISNSSGFKPAAGDIWFMFEKGGDIWIGSAPELQWRTDGISVFGDDSDDAYQELIQNPPTTRIAHLKERDVYTRDPQIGLECLRASGYACQVDRSHALFESRATGLPYLEVHHLIPIGLQREYRISLDTLGNVFALCPFCHRAAHHAAIPTARTLLGALSVQTQFLHDLSLSLDDLYALYSVETID